MKMLALRLKRSSSLKEVTLWQLLVSFLKHSNKDDINLNFWFLADDEGPGDDGGETVINIVEAHGLSEMQLSKKDVMAMLKGLMKKTVTYLTENGKEDRVAGFKKGATEMVKFIMGKFDEMQVFTGSSMDVEATLCFAYTMDGETDPTFLFFNDAYIQEKF